MNPIRHVRYNSLSCLPDGRWGDYPFRISRFIIACPFVRVPEAVTAFWIRLDIPSHRSHHSHHQDFAQHLGIYRHFLPREFDPISLHTSVLQTWIYNLPLASLLRPDWNGHQPIDPRSGTSTNKRHLRPESHPFLNFTYNSPLPATSPRQPLFASTHSFQLLLRHSCILVPATSAIRHLRDLDKPSFTFLDPPSLSSYLEVPVDLEDRAAAMEKRHFYTACAGAGETLSWADEWYTASWQVGPSFRHIQQYLTALPSNTSPLRFTASQSDYDSQASTGPVDPPASVWATEAACLALQSSLSANSLLTTSTASIPVITSGTQTGTVTTGIPVAATASAVSFPTPTATSTMPNRFDSSSDAARSASCAGEWDWQTAGTVSSLILGLLFGAIVWGIWSVLKGKQSLATLYQPRKALGLDR